MNAVAVIVPVMRRPQNAAPFMRSLVLTTEQATVYAIADGDDIDTANAWREAGAIVITSTGTSFAIKVNDGYRATSEPWLFVVGDDVQFHAGWLGNALGHADGFDVIGTNDLLTGRVVTGQHATHFFVRRTYIDTVGASWDGPGVVCHEGYRHWFVDDELVGAARQRGVWRSALCSIVEHLHPLNGTAPTDEVYMLGQSHATQDHQLFVGRAGAYGLAI
jgi:glycosyltransferase involved in cell wall biosynthesis